VGSSCSGEHGIVQSEEWRTHLLIGVGDPRNICRKQIEDVGYEVVGKRKGLNWNGKEWGWRTKRAFSAGIGVYGREDTKSQARMGMIVEKRLGRLAESDAC